MGKVKEAGPNDDIKSMKFFLNTYKFVSKAKGGKEDYCGMHMFIYDGMCVDNNMERCPLSHGFDCIYSRLQFLS